MSKPVKTIDVLRAARRWMVPERWCKLALGIRRDGTTAQCVLDMVGRFERVCVVGAIYYEGYRRGLNEDEVYPLVSALDRLALRDFGAGYAPVVNNKYGPEGARKLIDSAIAELEAQP